MIKIIGKIHVPDPKPSETPAPDSSDQKKNHSESTTLLKIPIPRFRSSYVLVRPFGTPVPTVVGRGTLSPYLTTDTGTLLRYYLTSKFKKLLRIINKGGRSTNPQMCGHNKLLGFRTFRKFADLRNQSCCDLRIICGFKTSAWPQIQTVFSTTIAYTSTVFW